MSFLVQDRLCVDEQFSFALCVPSLKSENALADVFFLPTVSEYCKLSKTVINLA